jgi:hypothetical protein
MAAVNAAVAGYTGAVVGIGNTTTEDSSQPTASIRKMLEAGEPVYVTATMLNGVFLAASMIAGVLQLVAKKTVDGANAASPAQLPNILVNGAGIKLQAGPSFIAIAPQGVLVYGPQIMVASPMTDFQPAGLPGNASGPGVLELGDAAGGVVIEEL